MDMFSRMTAIINAHKERSAWGKGVKAYALELVEDLELYAQYEGRTPATRQECTAWLLNGAKDWKAYFWGGSSLICDWQIAKRLCTPSELKRTHNGERRPNSCEQGLDVQARALFQATRLVLAAYDAASPADDDGVELPF